MRELNCLAILFDLDGVLVDSGEKIQQHWTRWAQHHGIDPQAAVEAAHGRSSFLTVAFLAPHLDARAEAAKIEAEQGLDTNGMRRIEGAQELVASLRPGTWAIVTSGKRDTALARLQFAELPCPSVLITADDVTGMKPDPECYLEAAYRLAVPADRCLVVEDSLVGIQAARAAGMLVAGVAKTYPPDALVGSDLIAANLSDFVITEVHEPCRQYLVRLR
jgi:mannitol-1-/sugar-/sorbitol-6-phosphatase